MPLSGKLMEVTDTLPYIIPSTKSVSSVVWLQSMNNFKIVVRQEAWPIEDILQLKEGQNKECSKEVQNPSPPTRKLLRLLWHMGKPNRCVSFTIVDQSVGMSEKRGPSLRRLINLIKKKYSFRRVEEYGNGQSGGEDPIPLMGLSRPETRLRLSRYSLSIKQRLTTLNRFSNN